MLDILGAGLGKQIVSIGTGPSLEEEIENLREIDCEIACVDKSFGILVGQGLGDKVKYVCLADANVDFQKWLRGYEDATEGVHLLANVCANPEWIEAWKGPITLTVNKDNIESEKIFTPLSGITELVPAASNVGNSMVVKLSSALLYDSQLLVGLDYCWYHDSNYYAFHDTDKRYWMRRLMGMGNGKLSYASGNMSFSSRWLADYVTRVMPAQFPWQRVIDCSDGMLAIPKGKLAPHLRAWEEHPVPQERIEAVKKKKRKTKVIKPYKGMDELFAQLEGVVTAIEYEDAA